MGLKISNINPQTQGGDSLSLECSGIGLRKRKDTGSTAWRDTEPTVWEIPNGYDLVEEILDQRLRDPK